MTAMANNNGGNRQRGVGGWRIFFWGAAAALVALPAVAMRFTTEVNWTASDFVFAAVLIGGVGLLLELAMRRSGSLAYRAGAAAAVLAGFATIWVNAAVGMIGSEDNPFNFVFLGIVALALALAGAVAVRARASGMAVVTALAAAAQLAAALVGTQTDLRGGILSAVFAAPWLLAAALFAVSGRQQR
jgi:hypothetical protein